MIQCPKCRKLTHEVEPAIVKGDIRYHLEYTCPHCGMKESQPVLWPDEYQHGKRGKINRAKRTKG